MHNDSIDTLLFRHYGHTAPTPLDLEEELCVSIRHEAAELQAQQFRAASLREQRLSRRKAMRLVAIGAAGLGVLNIGLEALHMLEANLVGQDVTQMTHP